MAYFEATFRGDKKLDDFSKEGQRIHALNSFLKDSTKGGGLKNNDNVLQHSLDWAEENIIPRNKFPPLKYVEELSNYLQPGPNKERAKEIGDLLERMCLERHRKILDIKPSNNKKGIRVIFERTNDEDNDHPGTPDPSNLIKYGVESMIESGPSLDEEFQVQLNKSYEFRVLQSTFYDHHGMVDLIADAISNGSLTKVEILLAQPHSAAAEERAHTYRESEGKIDQLPFFNSRVWEAVTRLQQLSFKYQGVDNSKTGDPIDIKVKLYASPPVIPIYQLRNEQKRNILLRVGVFWRQASSFKSPHLQLRGNRGLFVQRVEEHFTAIWKDEFKGWTPEEEEEVSGKQAEDLEDQYFAYLMSQRGTIPIPLSQVNISRLREKFDTAHQVGFLFPKPGKERPDYLYFKCFYYKPDEDSSSFCLRYERNSSTVQVDRTNQDSVYQGVVVQRHYSFAMFLIGTNRGSNQRVMTLNIPVGGNSLDKDEHFAIYSNTNIDNGSPYSQLLLLHKIDEELYDNKEAYEELEYTGSLNLNEYLPYLKDRRITLPPPLWNRPTLAVDKISGDYRQSFRAEEHDTYFNLLKKELEQAKHNVFFLGYPPSIGYEGEEAKTIKSYYDLHVELIERGVRIHRIILDPNRIKGEFKEYLRQMFQAKYSDKTKDEGKQTSKKGLFNLFVSNRKFPLDSDLILIDPDTATATSISSYLRERKIGPGSIPIRLEVIKENKSILQHKLDFYLGYQQFPEIASCNSFNALKELLKPLKIKG